MSLHRDEIRNGLFRGNAKRGKFPELMGKETFSLWLNHELQGCYMDLDLGLLFFSP